MDGLVSVTLLFEYKRIKFMQNKLMIENGPMVEKTQGGEHVTIGELSRLTGITTHNLRKWEKRYGAPEPVRLPSGHRRYPIKEVSRLRVIAKALESGYRASKVVNGTLEELQTFLGLETFSREPCFVEHPKTTCNDWMRTVQAFNEDKLLHGFQETWGRHGPMTFIQNYVGPFVKQVGICWRSGEISISQEHFATEVLSDFLSKKWRQMNQYKEGSILLLTTLPDEPHQIGLLMCAVITALTEYRILYLGPNAPYEEILLSAKNCEAEIICLSISGCANPEKTEDTLYKLRSELRKETDIVVGGAGASFTIPGVNYFESFSNYYDWISNIKIRK